MRNNPARALFLLLVLAAVGACGKVQARTEPVLPAPEPPALETPIPPRHVIIPVEIEPFAAAPAPAEEPPAPPPVRVTPRPAPRAEAAPPQPEPAAEPDAPRRTLQTPTNVGGTEQKIVAQMARATQDLGRIDYRALSAEGRAQYDIAKRFNQQAEEALKARNLPFAAQLADKAASLAALLLKS
jgi:hypothetical protein